MILAKFRFLCATMVLGELHKVFHWLVLYKIFLNLKNFASEREILLYSNYPAKSKSGFVFCCT